ncbi:MAG: Hint domain-containing protein [Litoreibacter sp.]|nr:Hint domain-containing protein [Litoreibacter sp.]
MSAKTVPTLGGGETMLSTGPGLLAGCKILTLEGYTPVAELKPGARVITRSGMKRLVALKKSTQRFKAVSVTAGSLGYTRPSRDLQLAPGQEVMVRDWRAEILFGRDAVVTRIDRLLDEKYIFSASTASDHEVFELEFESQEVFYADGVELVSKATIAIDADLPVFEAA